MGLPVRVGAGRDAEIREVLWTISKKLIWLSYFRTRPMTADQLRRTTRLVFTGSNRPVRAIDHSTRQAPRVASSQ